jgi:uncharacterized protein with PQ loop repeat
MDGWYGWVGYGLGVLYNTAQIVHVYRVKKTSGLSPTSLFIRIVSYSLVIIHGYDIQDSPTLYTTILGLIQLFIMSGQIYYYQYAKKMPNQTDPTTTVV